MANKYKYNYTYEEKIEEEDREVRNDLYRQQTEYYKSLTEINLIIKSVLTSMSKDELKDVIINNYIHPVSRI